MLPELFPRWLPGTLGPLVRLALPMLLSQAGQVLLQVTDAVMLGRVGALALAGAALAGNLVMFSLYFGFGILGAITPKVAQAYARAQAGGGGSAREAGRLMAGGALLGWLTGCGIAGAISVSAPHLGLLGQPAEVVAHTQAYIHLIAWSLPFGLTSVALGHSAEAMCRPWPVFAIMMGSVLVNIGLNAVLIFGLVGAPALGLTGAGLATLLARVVQLAAMLAWLRLDGWWRRWRPCAGLLLCLRAKGPELLRKGLPIAGQDVLEGGSFAVGNLMMGWVGAAAMAANQVAIAMAWVAWMFPYSIAAATSVRVAHGAGVKDWAAARRSGLAGVALGAGIMACFAVVYITQGRWLAGLFTKDAAVLEIAAALVTIAGFYQVSDAIQSISLGALRGLLDTRAPLIANAVCYWVLSLPTVYVMAFPMGMGAIGVWLGYLPWMLSTGLFFLVRFVLLTRCGLRQPGGSVADQAVARGA